MNSKKYVILSLVVLLGIYGFTTKKASGAKLQVDAKVETSSTLTENNNNDINYTLATPTEEFVEKFNANKTQFNTLATLLKDEYENTILEANANEYKDFVLSKKVNELLLQLDITAIKVNINISAVKTKVVMFTLGKSWEANQNASVVNTTAPIENALALTNNWYSIK